MDLNTGIGYRDGAILVGIREVMYYHINNRRYQSGAKRPKNRAVEFWTMYPGWSSTHESVDDALWILAEMGVEDLRPFIEDCKSKGWKA